MSNLTLALKKSGGFSLDGEEELKSLLTFVAELPVGILKLVSNPSGTIVRWNPEASVEEALSQIKLRLSGQETKDTLESEGDIREKSGSEEKGMEVETGGEAGAEERSEPNKDCHPMEVELS